MVYQLLFQVIFHRLALQLVPLNYERQQSQAQFIICNNRTT